MSLIVFSPHLDDGVLSASTQLVRPEAVLLTVFGGVPPVTAVRRQWDRLTGASSCEHRQRERLSENDVAAGILGCRVETWGELEAQYRSEPVNRTRLIARIRSVIEWVDEIWAPAAIGRHPDHVLVRDLVVAAAQESGLGDKLRFQADLPYSLQYGWPTWVTGAAPDPYLDVDGWFQDELAECGFVPDHLTARVHVLDHDLRVLKERASLAYRSQMPALGLDPAASSRWDAFVGYEVSWTTTS